MAGWYPAEWVAMLWGETTEVYSILLIRVTLQNCCLNLCVSLTRR